ncbi:hypothetical protein [Campylobacter estrildidarum]|uniref:Uncharacterized protein n=1 Tax=Campylobacter estrildidarum TaxID=2510189 RepID=A0A4U7BR44_9BACT|nr:hypothetical protein [Campylobacter estrildidarum]TKX30647.1 hypothetical protein CQA69_05275 [Campylobacter estrildidarum]
MQLTSVEEYKFLSPIAQDIQAIRLKLNGIMDELEVFINEKKDATIQEYKDLVEQKIEELRKLYERVVNPFDYSSDLEPYKPNLGEIWFKKDTAEIYIYKENPDITYFGKETPKTSNTGEIWFKNTNDEDFHEGQFYVAEQVVEGKAWIDPTLPATFKAKFNQSEQPKDDETELGDIWYRNNTKEYLIYVKTTSGNFWANPQIPSTFSAKFSTEEKPQEPNLGDVWYKSDTKEYLVYARVTDTNTWVLKTDLAIKAYIWQKTNKPETNYSEPPSIEKEPIKPTDAVNKKYIDDLINSINDEIKNKVGLEGDETIDGAKTFKKEIVINDPKADNQAATKKYADHQGGLVTSAAAIDFTKGVHFNITLSAKSAISVSNWGSLIGKSGTITINNANNITAFNAPFKFRATQSNFSGTEIFAYFVVSNSHIRLVRS